MRYFLYSRNLFLSLEFYLLLMPYKTTQHESLLTNTLIISFSSYNSAEDWSVTEVVTKSLGSRGNNAISTTPYSQNISKGKPIRSHKGHFTRHSYFYPANTIVCATKSGDLHFTLLRLSIWHVPFQKILQILERNIYWPPNTDLQKS